jgi:KUP system potassium uptake protein
VTFQSSDRLTVAYGLAVAATMTATSIAFYAVAVRVLRWRRVAAGALVSVFLVLDLTFLAAALPKFLEGAWFPLTLGTIFAAVAITWLGGRRRVARSLAAQQQPVEEFLRARRPARGEPEGTMVLLTGDPGGVPFVHHHRWVSARLDEETVVLMTLVRAARPFVPDGERVRVERPGPRFVRLSAAFGYMEQPRIGPILRSCKLAALDFDRDDTSFVYAAPKIVPAGGMPRWQRGLFDLLMRLAQPLPDELEIRPERRVALGVEVDL